MAQDLDKQARDLAERLREHGHTTQADELTRHLTQEVGRGVLFTLREVCETLLTAIEAIDPVTQTLIEDLRLEVEKRLRLHSDHD
jgi:hypothetical protein